MTTARPIALVTGASQGIGRAVALGLLQIGFRVVLAARRAEPLEALAEEARQQGGEALAVPCDVTDAASVEALFARIRETYGRLDLLFNNAGVGAPAVPIDELELDAWHRAVNTNLTGVFLCSRAAFALMRADVAPAPARAARRSPRDRRSSDASSCARACGRRG